MSIINDSDLLQDCFQDHHYLCYTSISTAVIIVVARDFLLCSEAIVVAATSALRFIKRELSLGPFRKDIEVLARETPFLSIVLLSDFQVR